MENQKSKFKEIIKRSMFGCDKELCLYPLCYNFIGMVNKDNKDKERLKEIILSLNSKNIILCQKKINKILTNNFFDNSLKNINFIENFVLFFKKGDVLDIFKINSFINNYNNESLSDFIDFSNNLSKIFEWDKNNIIILINIFKNNKESRFYNLEIFKKNLWNILFSIILIKFIYDPHFYFNCLNLIWFLLEIIGFLDGEILNNLNIFKNLENDYFNKLIEKIQNLITIWIMLKDSNEYDLNLLLKILNIWNKVRIKLKIGNKQLFINKYINKNIDFKFLILSYYKKKLEKSLDDQHYMNYPFLFNTETKVELIGYESQLEMKNQINHLFQNNNNILNILNFNNIFFDIKVRREYILEDTLNQLNIKAKGSEMKKNLKIKFEGEPGVDEGGVKKEFFQILIEKLFDPNFGMFVQKSNRYMWFNSLSFECSLNFELVGIILGMAIYNSIVLDLHFPKALYKKLMNEKLELEDLEELDPEIFTTMKNILKYEGNVEDMDLTFSLEIDNFGCVEITNLIENGENIKVNNENRELYIEKYLNWYFDYSIKDQYQPFRNGFYKVIQSDLFYMFESDDVFKAICGSINLDFSELEKTSIYQDGYTKNHRVILEFWEILYSFTEEQKKKFLRFLTGSDRAPIKGLSQVRMVISRKSPDCENLPSAHTCFNHLLIPEYINKEKLNKKLWQAIENCEGFGLY